MKSDVPQRGIIVKLCITFCHQFGITCFNHAKKDWNVMCMNKNRFFYCYYFMVTLKIVKYVKQMGVLYSCK